MLCQMIFMNQKRYFIWKLSAIERSNHEVIRPSLLHKSPIAGMSVVLLEDFRTAGKSRKSHSTIGCPGGHSVGESDGLPRLAGRARHVHSLPMALQTVP